MSDRRRTGVCSICDRTAKLSCLHPQACSRCYATQVRPNRACCATCGKPKTTLWQVDGRLICRKCRLDGKCDQCGRSDVGLSINRGKVLCRKCYHDTMCPKSICSMCGAQDICQARVDEKPICPKCYIDRVWHKQDCTLCGEPQSAIAVVDGHSLCRKCHEKPLVIGLCHICNLEKKLYYGSGTVCASCYAQFVQPKHMCAKCGEVEKSMIRLENGHLCRRCWNKLPRRRAQNFIDRQKRRASELPSLSIEEWRRVMNSTMWTCFYCGQYIGGDSEYRTIDHIVPISKGGLTVPENLVPCCRGCNSSKNASDVAIWLCKKPDVAIRLSCDDCLRLGIQPDVDCRQEDL